MRWHKPTDKLPVQPIEDVTEKPAFHSNEVTSTCCVSCSSLTRTRSQEVSGFPGDTRGQGDEGEAETKAGVCERARAEEWGGDMRRQGSLWKQTAEMPLVWYLAFMFHTFPSFCLLISTVFIQQQTFPQMKCQFLKARAAVLLVSSISPKNEPYPKSTSNRCLMTRRL